MAGPTSQTDGFLFRGRSAAAHSVRELIHRASAVDSTVLVTGESGVGKELVARDIHFRSQRKTGTFVPLNCAAIPANLIEAELFGHEAGAFTDARLRHRGAFEMSDGGTLFLDEVGDMAIDVQPKLLRVLETGEIQRVGGESRKSLEIRVIAATNHNLRSMCRERRFRRDLYYRLCVLEIQVPPLRERVEDIAPLTEYFARHQAQVTGRPFDGINEEAIRYLEGHPWPGNVRELRHQVERAMVLNESPVLGADCFQLEPESFPGMRLQPLLKKDWRAAREGFQTIYAKQLLARHDGNVPRAARAAGIAPGSLYKMLRRLDLLPGRSPRDE